MSEKEKNNDQSDSTSSEGGNQDDSLDVVAAPDTGYKGLEEKYNKRN